MRTVAFIFLRNSMQIWFTVQDIDCSVNAWLQWLRNTPVLLFWCCWCSWTCSPNLNDHRRQFRKNTVFVSPILSFLGFSFQIVLLEESSTIKCHFLCLHPDHPDVCVVFHHFPWIKLFCFTKSWKCRPLLTSDIQSPEPILKKIS